MRTACLSVSLFVLSVCLTLCFFVDCSAQVMLHQQWRGANLIRPLKTEHGCRVFAVSYENGDQFVWKVFE